MRIIAGIPLNAKQIGKPQELADLTITEYDCPLDRRFSLFCVDRKENCIACVESGWGIHDCDDLNELLQLLIDEKLLTDGYSVYISDDDDDDDED